MDGENKGKPYEQMDDLGGKYPPLFFGNTHIPSWPWHFWVDENCPNIPKWDMNSVTSLW